MDGVVLVAAIDPAAAPELQQAIVVGAFNVTLPSESRETNATMEITLSTGALESLGVSPADLVVYHIDGSEMGHSQLETRITATTNESVTVDAETPGFSTFVVAASQTATAATTEPQVNLTPAETETEAPAVEATEEPAAESAPTRTNVKPEASTVSPRTTSAALPGFSVLLAVTILLPVLPALGLWWRRTE